MIAEIGKQSAEESRSEIKEYLNNAALADDMVFVAAGMGWEVLELVLHH